MNDVAADILMHYGTPRRSGRYPWGSGDDPYQHSGDFLSRVEELRKENFEFTDKDGKTWKGDTAIAKSFGLSTTQFRTQVGLAKDERRALNVATAKGLREKGYSLNEIAAQMGFKNDSSVRTLLNENSEARMKQAQNTADYLKTQVDKYGMIDVGTGVERELNVSREKLEQALYILEMEGYNTFGGRAEQVTNRGKWTTLKVLCPPDTPYKVDEDGNKTSSAIYEFDKIHSAYDHVSHDGGDSFDPKWVYPKSIDSSRLKIRYAEDGGIDKDGVVEIRRNVDDLSLGESKYAQVRILVDGTHYIKGMAVYGDDMPDGVDLIFNTNKSRKVEKMDVLKPIKNDPDNPFGSLIKDGVTDPKDETTKGGGQSYYYDKDGNKQLSAINKRSEEGDWGHWADKLSSQFLGKQSKALIYRQLDLATADKQDEFDEICSLTNPTVKKALLRSFSDDCDSAAVHLNAAALPRQKYQVILPLTSIKDNEVYAPNYKDGETVALVRYPHGGTFEIPMLKVNNKNKEGRRVLGTTPADAIGINKTVADRLSGADFDGDTVMVIPTGGKIRITSTPALKGLKDFDPKLEYGPSSSKPVMVDADTGTEYYERNGRKYARMNNTQTEMGKISNLITDMTLKGAPPEKIERAVRHSMVVIDAEKHKLDYRQSFIDNDIASLKKEYQGAIGPDGKYHEGAGTLLSRAKSEKSVLKRKGTPKVNMPGKPWYDPSRPEGALIYNSVEEHYTDKDGKDHIRMQKSTRMAETDDARTLSTGTVQEEAYATYANKMKSLANQARKEMMVTGNIKYDASAHVAYKTEVDSLNNKLDTALRNAPREREAQLMANSIIKAKKQSNPDMTKEEVKKASQKALTQARVTVGAKRHAIDISDKEWEAIQAGAISEHQLTQILDHADMDVLRNKATPRATTQLSQAKQNHISAMQASGYTTSQIAEKLGVSPTTVLKYIDGKE